MLLKLVTGSDASVFKVTLSIHFDSNIRIITCDEEMVPLDVTPQAADRDAKHPQSHHLLPSESMGVSTLCQYVCDMRLLTVKQMDRVYLTFSNFFFLFLGGGGGAFM